MSLTLKQRKDVGKIRLAWCFIVNARGHPLGVFPKGRYPYLEEVRALAYDKLENMGYQIRRTSPDDANCVIRVYNLIDYAHGDEKYCLLGAICYTKSDNKNQWVWYDKNDEEHTLDYESCKIDEKFRGRSEIVEAEFFDTYVKVY